MTEYWRVRLPIALVGLGFLLAGPVVSYLGYWRSAGRIAAHPPVTYLTGEAAQWMAASLSLFGLAILGVLWPRRGMVIVWMSVLMAAAVGVNFIRPVTCTNIDQLTRECH